MVDDNFRIESDEELVNLLIEIRKRILEKRCFRCGNIMINKSFRDALLEVRSYPYCSSCFKNYPNGENKILDHVYLLIDMRVKAMEEKKEREGMIERYLKTRHIEL